MEKGFYCSLFASEVVIVYATPLSESASCVITTPVSAKVYEYLDDPKNAIAKYLAQLDEVARRFRFSMSHPPTNQELGCKHGISLSTISAPQSDQWMDDNQILLKCVRKDFCNWRNFCSVFQPFDTLDELLAAVRTCARTPGITETYQYRDIWKYPFSKDKESGKYYVGKKDYVDHGAVKIESSFLNLVYAKIGSFLRKKYFNPAKLKLTVESLPGPEEVMRATVLYHSHGDSRLRRIGLNFTVTDNFWAVLAHLVSKLPANCDAFDKLPDSYG